jgi:hypothetical protein
MICPNTASDVDGRYRGMDQKIHQDPAYTNYTVFSSWDTFRAQHPLYTIIDPVQDQAWIRALLRKHEQGGILPMWDLASNYTGCMIGYHAVPVIVDACSKGLRDYDTKLAMEAVGFASQYDGKKSIPYHTEAEIDEASDPKDVPDLGTIHSTIVGVNYPTRTLKLHDFSNPALHRIVPSCSRLCGIGGSHRV